MRNSALIAWFLMAAAGAVGCGGADEKPADKPSPKPPPVAAEAAKPRSSTGTSEESPTLPADEEMPADSSAAADGDSPTVPDDAAADKSEEPAGENSEEPAGEPGPAETPGPKTVGAVGSVALAREFESDKAAAESKYKDKSILVEGKVVTYLAKDGYIYLDGSKDIRKIICKLKAPATEEIKVGDTVAVEGQFDLVAVLGVSLKACELVKVNP